LLFKASFFFDSKKRPGDSQAKRKTPTHRFEPLFKSLGHMEAVDNNRF
jgi:hypothetical protein